MAMDFMWMEFFCCLVGSKKNVIIFGVDMSLSVYIHNKRKRYSW